MRRDFLKSLGIEDKEVIDKIMDENSSDIGKAKGELQTFKDKVAELEGQITVKNGEIANLQKSVGDVETLNERIRQLETDKSNLTTELNTKMSQLQKTHAIEGGVRDAKAKNVKAVMALLDMEKITFNDGKLEGLEDQLKTLTEGADTAFLFGTQNPPNPKGLNPSEPPNPNNNPPTAQTLSQAIAKHLSGGK